MKLENRLRTSVAAVALALSAGAWAMTPVDESNRGVYSPQGSSVTQDDFGNEVHSRDFSGTYELENSGRGSSLSMEGSSARIQEDENSASGNSWDASDSGSSQSVEDEAAANQDAFDWSAASSESPASSGDELATNEAAQGPAISSDVAGSGYTKDSDLMASSDEGTQEDQLVVIVPEDWEGSVPDLIAAIEQSSDDSALVVIDGEASGGDTSSNVPEEVAPSYPE
jgi:hypothetical protein